MASIRLLYSHQHCVSQVTLASFVATVSECLWEHRKDLTPARLQLRPRVLSGVVI